jgi:hypothetical protein
MSELWFWDNRLNKEEPETVLLGNYRALRVCSPMSSSSSVALAASAAAAMPEFNCSK